MTRTLRLVFLALVLLLPASVLAQVKTFTHTGVARDALRYETWIKANAKPGAHRASELASAARQASAAGDQRGAARALSMALVLEPNNARAWLDLAKALLATTPDAQKSSERYDLPVNASGAAYRAYERAGDANTKAQALAVLGEALKRRSYWRPALEAYKTSLALADNPQIRETYDTLRTEHGFRLIDYKVEQEATQPRVCLQFSESLQRGQEFNKFIAVDGKDAAGLTAEGKQLCLEGVAHGKRYEILVRAGLPSDVGEVLEKGSELAIYVRDRSPSVRFTGRSYVLPSRGQSGIPVVSINTEKIDVEVYRVGDRNLASTLNSGDLQRQLSTYDISQLKDSTGSRIYSGNMSVTTRLNEEVTTAVPVGDAVPELKPGVYVMTAKPANVRDDGDSLATQWFIVSDLGLTTLTGDDGIHAFVRSLATAQPISGARVRLVARNNEVLGQGTSDARGYVHFEAGLKRGEGGMAPALLMAEGATGGDYAFLDLTASAFDLSDRGVKGRTPPGPLDGYLFTERGVYRPGEDVFVTALVRDRGGKASGVPTTLIVTRPDGVEHRRIALTEEQLGGRSSTLKLAGSSMTGTWRARLYADPKADALASVAFLVEDFVPERLDLTIDPVSTTLVPDEKGALKIAGRYLYGSPAANLALEGDIVVKPSTKDVAAYPGYRFGLADEEINPVRKPLEGLPNTDAQGAAELAVMLPAIQRTARSLEAQVLLRLREPGGRTIERSVTLPVDAKMTRVGIKPLFKDAQIGEGELAGFEAILVDEDGKRIAGKGFRWQLMRLDQRWQWYSRDGRWTYEPLTITRKVADGVADFTADEPVKISAKVDWGRYRLEVISNDAGGPASSVVFNAGWYADEGADSPEVLDVALDKQLYKAGDTAKLKVSARQAGKALVAVLGEGLLASQEVNLPAGGGEVAIPVKADWGPGAYVTAMMYRPMDEKAKRMPSRAIGVKWLPLDHSAKTLNVALTPEQKVRSGAMLAVPLKIGGINPGEEARVTVAAVDLGILNLTRYQAPAPESWFHAQRSLGTEIRDFYGRLIDGMRADRGSLRSGGDEGGVAMQGNPSVEATVALYSGIVKVQPDGTARVEFQMPEFNGTVRVMAVAWSADKVGHATTDVIVRDPVALIAAGPRFLTLGDEARLQLDVHNVEGPDGTFYVTVEQLAPTGGRATVAKRDVTLALNQRKAVRFSVKPQDVGTFTYDIKVTNGSGMEVSRQLTFDVKPPAGDIRRVTVSKLAPSGGKLTLGADLLADLIPGRTKVSVSVGPIANLDVPGLLTQLDRYPYGCAEQTTSRAMPLLYANQLSVQSGLPRDGELKARIEAAIDRVFEMQDSSGAFGVWGPSGGDMWLTSYVTEFLTRAREQGFQMKQQAFTQALDRLQNFVSYAQDFEKGGEARAYALYVLARNGRAPIGELRYYADTRLDRFSTPLAKAQLGAALAMLGDRERAERVFRTALGSDQPDENTRQDFGSTLRDNAALVTLASETRVLREDASRLAGSLAEAYATRAYTSTQEQAWMLLAARALAEESRDTALSVNGSSHKGSLNRTLTAAEVTERGLVIQNDGDAAVDAVISVIGAALTPEPPISRDFRIERSYYTLDGKPVDLQSAKGGKGQLRQTDRLVVVLKVEATTPGGRVMLVDHLPAGLEIENPRLLDSADLKSFTWLNTTVRPEHTEFRDDRFVAAFNLFGRAGGDEDDANKGPASAATVAYMVRAVTPGSFVHPAATVEDMYRPDRFARTAAGRLEVLARE